VKGGWSLQVDILDKKSEQLSPAYSGPGDVWLHSWLHSHRVLGPWPHRLTAVTWMFSVEAKGLELSNLLTARLVLLVRSTESECVCPGQTRCALLLHEV
jgi:hypothetical protein